MNTLTLKLPQVSRSIVEHATPVLVIALLFGLALTLPPVGHRLVPIPVLMVHAGAAISALLLGALVLFRRKGTAQHKALGKTWVLLMLIASLSSFAIQSRGHLSMIHLLAIVTPVYLFMAVYYARRGNVKGHLRCMRGVYFGLLVAGVLAIATPGRALTQAVFAA